MHRDCIYMKKVVYAVDPGDGMCVFCCEDKTEETMHCIFLGLNLDVEYYVGCCKSCFEMHGTTSRGRICCRMCRKKLNIDMSQLAPGCRIMGGSSAFCMCRHCLQNVPSSRARGLEDFFRYDDDVEHDDEDDSDEDGDVEEFIQLGVEISNVE